MKTLGSTCLCAALVLFCATVAAHPHHGDAGERDTARPFEDHAAVKRARAFTTWMAVRSDRVQRWLWKARFEDKRTQRACLSRSLSQLHAIERMGRASRRAIEAAVRVNGLTGYHMVRLVHLHDASQAQLEMADRCRRKISRRVRMPTQYSVRVLARPDLPEDSR
jgi:hypothetical protein